MAGQAAMYTINASGVGGNFPGAVTFSASGLPQATTAGFVPPSVSPGAGTLPTTMSLTTTVRTGEVPPISRKLPHGPQPLMLWTLAALMVLTSLLVISRTSRTRRPATIGLAALLFLIVGGSTACNAPKKATGTPAGTYTVMVTGTSGGVSHTINVTLTVQ
jgi:hypothetical protein